jgi:hypothetical protein
VVAAVALTAAGPPGSATRAPGPGGTRNALAAWAKTDLSPECGVIAEGLAGFAGGLDAGGHQQSVLVCARNPQDLPQFSWVTPVLGHLKTSVGGAYQGFNVAN